MSRIRSLVLVCALFSLVAATSYASVTGSFISKENYNVRVEADNSYDVGKQGSFDVIVESKGCFHINKQYPQKFKVKTNGAVYFQKTVLRKNDARMTNNKLVFSVPVIPQKKGKLTVGGKIYLGVCSSTNCSLGRHNVSVVLNAE